MSEEQTDNRSSITPISMDTLKAIPAKTIINYLENNGWIEVKNIERELKIYAKYYSENKRHLVWMPESESFYDYPAMVARLIETIARAEKRNELDLLADLGAKIKGLQANKLDSTPEETGWYWFDGSVDLNSPGTFPLTQLQVREFCKIWQSKEGVLYADIDNMSCEISAMNGTWYRAIPPWEWDNTRKEAKNE